MCVSSLIKAPHLSDNIVVLCKSPQSAEGGCMFVCVRVQGVCACVCVCVCVCLCKREGGGICECYRQRETEKRQVRCL